MLASNSTELYMMMTSTIDSAVKYVLDKIYDTMIDSLQYYQIGKYNPNSIYQATGEFEDAWNTEIAGDIGDVIARFYYDTSAITTYNKELAQHTSPSQKHGDVTEKNGEEGLLDIVFNALTAEHSMFGEIPARDAWRRTINIFNSRGEQWLKEGMTRQGFDMKKEGSVIESIISGI